MGGLSAPGWTEAMKAKAREAIKSPGGSEQYTGAAAGAKTSDGARRRDRKRNLGTTPKIHLGPVGAK